MTGALSPHRFRPASLPVFGQRRPSQELFLDGASPAPLVGMRNSEPPWLNGPELFVFYESPHLRPDSHSAGKEECVLVIWGLTAEYFPLIFRKGL